MLRNPRPTVEPLTDASAPDREQPFLGSYTSQAFTLWTEGVGTPSKRLILDLGSANSSSIAYFSEYPTQLHIADLRSDLPIAVPQMDDEEAEERAQLERRALNHVMPEIAEGSQHGVLCWDLLNYLTRPQFVMMGQWLSSKLRPDGVAMVSIFTGSTMPAVPGRYEIAGDNQLDIKQQSDSRVTCPRFNQADFKRYWADFEVSRSYLMRNERQEFILRRR